MEIYKYGTMIAGRYEIIKLAGEGGMGMVYIGFDHHHDHPVALKTFKPELLPDRAARDRFLREGTAWVELGNHPHIVRCYEVKYTDPTAFLVLELIGKEQNMSDASLRSWLIPGHKLTIEQALLFALQIARGMQHATETIPGFVHRDLKPENVLVGDDKVQGTNINRLRVTDFGLAKTISESNLQPSVGNDLQPTRVQFTRGVGTPLYMAPEQWKGEPVGIFTDVYAFGCIFFEMITGNMAVKGKTIGDLAASHCDGKLQPIPSNLPRNIVELIELCTALSTNQRINQWTNISQRLDDIYTQYSKKTSLPQMNIVNSDEGRYSPLVSSYNEIGNSYLGIGKVQLAIGFFEKALKISREKNNLDGQGISLGNLGNAYINLGDMQRAIQYLEQRLKIANESRDLRGEANAAGNLGNAYLGLGNPKKAIEYFERALKLDRELDDVHGIGNALAGLGIANMHLGEKRDAIRYHEECLKLFRDLKNRRGEGSALGNLGNTYVTFG